MTLQLKPYMEQSKQWPASGRCILAQFDDDSIVVYQAYKPSIGQFAATHGYFGGEFSLTRMTWIKTNFLWMMYRSGWGTKESQEVTLAIRLKREAFDRLLAEAVPSSFGASIHEDFEQWREAVKHSNVRLQWDPDHDPRGENLNRRAIQLGLRGEVAKQYAREWLLEIEDISDLVAEQRSIAMSGDWTNLHTPSERPYMVDDPSVRERLKL